MQSAIEQEQCEPASSPQRRCDNFIQAMKTAAQLGKAVNWKSTFRTSLTLQTRAPKCAHDKKRYRLLIWEYENESRGADFEPFFADSSKAILCYRHDRLGHTPPAHRVTIRALRYIYRSLRTSRTTSISAIRLRHLDHKSAQEPQSPNHRLI
jgi:hypothetical protein